MTVYISGPVTGIVNHNRPAFEKAQNTLIDLGFDVINPLLLTVFHPMKEWAEYMKEDIVLLMQADAIHMLDGWRDSKGAVLEYTIALALGYTFV